MGVWIETNLTVLQLIISWSHPTWVCGLKLSMDAIRAFIGVTPYVGVWIETCLVLLLRLVLAVTPYVGVWIETGLKAHRGA